MNLLLSTLVLVAGLTQASKGAAASQNAYEMAIAQYQALEEPQALTNTAITSGESSLGEPFLPEQAQENVLVVPTPDLPAEGLADLTEDMTVMCRIFDKSVPATGTGVGFAYGDRNEVFRYAFDQQTRRAQGLYLDGYGALFFIQVAYPLVPQEPQEQAQPKPKESTDAVWSQTIQEMTGQQNQDEQGGRNVPSYNSQKVENLKKTLIKTLAHASNIRTRRPQDFITLVVGPLDDSKAYSYPRSTGGRSSTGYSSQSRAIAGRWSGRATPGTMPGSAAMMVMRVTKADVDAFAKTQLTLAQFTEKVQTFWSRPTTSSESPRKPPTSTAAPATRR